MMCEVMPTISEDTALSQRGSQSSASDPDSHFEQLMVNMLDERDRLLDTLRETQESLSLAQQHLQDVIYDRDSLQRQLSSALPQVRRVFVGWKLRPRPGSEETNGLLKVGPFLILDLSYLTFQGLFVVIYV